MESPVTAPGATQLAGGVEAAAQPQVDSLHVGRRRGEVWVDSAEPRLAWTTRAPGNDWLQAAAELELTRPTGVETARLAGHASVDVAWPFAPLAAREECRLRLRVFGDDDLPSPWSESHILRAAAMADGEWTAQMIGGASTERGPFLLRTEFDIPAPVRRATLYATARGGYQALLNGAEVDDHRLKPGWTSYQWRLLYETTDVTALVAVGRNTLGLTVAGGWYTERFGFFDAAREYYGTEAAAAAVLVVELETGETRHIATGDAWRVGDGPLTSSGIYAGETYDARREQPGWAEAGFDDSAWDHAQIIAGLDPEPTPRSGPPVRAIEEISPVALLPGPAGSTIVDFGQNIVGHVRLRVAGERGDVITLRHAEVLENGGLALRPLRAAAATDSYTLRGGGDEVWEPRFTFHGFRYAQIDGWRGEVSPDAVTAVVVHSDMRRTGWFTSSDPLLNRLHDNVVWSMRGNFLSIPTDCPQRDERLGWTGDIQVFAPSAAFLYDCTGLLSSWLEDLELEQTANGGVPPHVVPDVLGEVAPAGGWGDAATVVPHVLHERFGDASIVRRQYASMRAWTDRVLEIAGDDHLVHGVFQFGDWLDPDAPPDLPGKAKTDRDLVATAYLHRSALLTADAARLLGFDDDFERYAAAASAVKTAFLAEYVTQNGRLVSDAPSAYALALVNGLFADDAQRQAMGDRLAFLSRSAGYRISTGFLGTPVIADALTSTGHLDVAERLLLQTENPSWLFPVTMGATTVWERWDSMLEDGSVNPGGMTSFNHYALGAIADWLHRAVAGLAPAEPGYRRIAVAPKPLASLDAARAELDSPYGRVAVGWHRAGTRVTVEAIIPANATATVTLPGASQPFDVGSGAYEWTVDLETPTSTFAPLSMDSSMAEVIDDPEAYRILSAAFDRHDASAAVSFRRTSEWTPGNFLRDALNRAPRALVAEVSEEFAALTERRRGTPPEGSR